MESIMEFLNSKDLFNADDAMNLITNKVLRRTTTIEELEAKYIVEK